MTKREDIVYKLINSGVIETLQPTKPETESTMRTHNKRSARLSTPTPKAVGAKEAFIKPRNPIYRRPEHRKSTRKENSPADIQRKRSEVRVRSSTPNDFKKSSSKTPMFRKHKHSLK